MDFTPHTEDDVARMLAVVGAGTVDDLFDHIPPALRLDRPLDVPDGLAEPDVVSLIDEYGAANASDLVCFAGAGIYDHYLPPAVRSLTLRPEFVTSYTPYQAEASQGVLQLLFEYQSMIAAITGLPVANASLYDGATAAVEAVNMAVSATGRTSVWVSRGVHPHTREAVATFAAARDIEVVEHPLVDGRTAWAADAGQAPAAVLVAQPNYLGVIEEYEAAQRLAADHHALAIAAVDPVALGLLRSPGAAGFDVAVGEGQPFGNPMSFGGPVVGIFATTTELMRRLPGRLVGRTVDADGRTGYVLTLRTREQDIRREKASSNICTNQTLNAIAAAVQLAWLGPSGLREIAERSAQKAHYLAGRLVGVPGVEMASDASFLREFAVLLPEEPDRVVLAMAERGFLAGVPLPADYPEFPGGLLVAVTERRTRAELDGYAEALREVLADG